MSWRSSLYALAVLWRMKRAQDSDRPGIVNGNPQAEAVLARAEQLVRAGRQDATAVGELRTLADGKRRTLRQAEEQSRFDGQHLEKRFENSVYRLLVAARTNASVRPPTPEDAGRIEAIEAFGALSESEQWRRLISLEPRLRPLADDFVAGRLGPPRRPDLRGEPAVDGDTAGTRFDAAGRPFRIVPVDLGRPPSEGEQEAINASTRTTFALGNELRALVGPQSATTDLVLGSGLALALAQVRIQRAAYAPFDMPTA